MNRRSLLPATATDRRKTQRFPVNVPLTLTIDQQKVSAYTKDLSNRGAYFFVAGAQSPKIENDFEFVVELPPEITLSTYCWIRCRARLLRTEEISNSMSGVAARIVDYAILREEAPVA